MLVDVSALFPQALKKFTVDQFVMDNVTVSSPIPSRAVYEMAVDDTCSIINSNFTTINSGAFMFQGNILPFFHPQRQFHKKNCFHRNEFVSVSREFHCRTDRCKFTNAGEAICTGTRQHNIIVK